MITENVKIANSEAGFTLIELMNVMVISSIIAIGAGIIIVSSYRFCDKASQKAFLQREMNFSFEVMGKRIRESDMTEYVIYRSYGGMVGLSGSCLYVEYANGDCYHIYQSNNNAMMKKNLDPAEVMLANLVTDLSFSTGSNKIIQVSMTCTIDQMSLSSACQYRFRN